MFSVLIKDKDKLLEMENLQVYLVRVECSMTER